jgi:hypothetical protein
MKKNSNNILVINNENNNLDLYTFRISLIPNIIHTQKFSLGSKNVVSTSSFLLSTNPHI